MATQKNAKENTVTGPTGSMVSVQVQGRWKGDLYEFVGRGAKPLWEGSKRRGDTPHPPSFGGVERGVWEGT